MASMLEITTGSTSWMVVMSPLSISMFTAPSVSRLPSLKSSSWAHAGSMASCARISACSIMPRTSLMSLPYTGMKLAMVHAGPFTVLRMEEICSGNGASGGVKLLSLAFLKVILHGFDFEISVPACA